MIWKDTSLIEKIKDFLFKPICFEHKTYLSIDEVINKLNAEKEKAEYNPQGYLRVKIRDDLIKLSKDVRNDFRPVYRGRIYFKNGYTHLQGEFVGAWGSKALTYGILFCTFLYLLLTVLTASLSLIEFFILMIFTIASLLFINSYKISTDIEFIETEIKKLLPIEKV